MTERAEVDELVLTRVFDAPRQKVFDAWTTPEAVARWWGPKGFTLPSCEMDFRTGGAYRFVMRGPDGAEYPFHGVYREIAPPSRIVFTAVLEGMGAELLTTVTFEEEGARTRLTVRQTTPPAGPARAGQRQGWSEQLDRLAASVA